MAKKRLFIIIAALFILLSLIFVFFAGIKKKRAALQLNAHPRATVFIDAKEAGTTPYRNDKLSSGEILIKMVPEDNKGDSFERKLMLNPETETVINWEFNADYDNQAGEILYLEKTSLKDRAGLIVACIPDSCSVTVDGQMRGFAPLNLEDVGQGSHRIVISLPGYKEKEIMAKAVNHYRLVVEAKLAKDDFFLETAKEEATGSADLDADAADIDQTTATADIATPYVVILDTPTGWLRVRSGPSTAATESAKVDPGEKFPLLDEANGWFEIEYEEGSTGWISGTYAEKFE